MQIERIKLKDFEDLSDVDWILPSGSILVIFKDINVQKLFEDLILHLFYDQESQLLAAQNRNPLAEIWITQETKHFIIRYETIRKDDEIKQLKTLFDGNGQQVRLPETMTIGEYFFKARLHAFRQGGMMRWPDKDSQDNLFSRINNLSQGGDEELSLTKVRASLIGAQKRVKDQRESMEQVKTEYDALRNEWEHVHRHQEAERLLLIEIKNLQESEGILSEKIAVTTKIQQRLKFLAQNSDYRDLRQLQDEISRLEERKQSLEDSLKGISRESLDWAIIENFREECMEWACLQKDVRRLTFETEVRFKQIEQIQKLLHISGYQEFREDEEQQLRRVIEERDAAQARLNKLVLTKQELEMVKLTYEHENARYSTLAKMSQVSEDDINWITKIENKLNLWRSYKVCSLVDKLLVKQLGVKSIDERLSSRLHDYYQRYNVSTYMEFMSQLKEFRHQQQQIDKTQKKMGKLIERIVKEPTLQRIIDVRNETLRKAFTAVHAADFTEWLKGWSDYQQKKKQRTLEMDLLNKELEQKLDLENKLAVCTERMSENLQNWGIPMRDREEVLAAILNIASQLQERDDINEEVAVFSETFAKMLGNRDMEQLALVLEPLAELEREQCLSNEERLAEMSLWEKDRVEIRQRLEKLNQRLQSKQQVSSLSVLEKKIEVKKRQWTAYADLRRALNDAQAILDLSWLEWQTKYEKTLSEEKKWIFEHCFAQPSNKFVENETALKRNYFSYRMAIAQLALPVTSEVPLFFSVGEISEEDQIFWEDIVKYLTKLALSRQVFFGTRDVIAAQKLSCNGWSSFDLGPK